MRFRQKTHRDKDGNIRQGQTIQLMHYTYDAENKHGRHLLHMGWAKGASARADLGGSGRAGKGA